MISAWTADCNGLRLLPLYEIYRASVRAKIDWLMVLQTKPLKRREYYAERFAGYIEFIRQRLNTPVVPGRSLQVVMGLPATGKSTYAAHLKGDTATVLLSSDLIRKRMAHLHPEQNAGQEAFAGAYDAEATRRVYRRLIALARLALKAGFDVIIDATFGRAEHRRLVAALAHKTGVELVYHRLRADEAEIRRRVEKRRQQGAVSDLVDFEIWRSLAERFEDFSDPELHHARLVEVDQKIK